MRRTDRLYHHVSLLSQAQAVGRYAAIDLAADDVGRQYRQPIITVFRPAVFDRHILTLDVTGFAQPLVMSARARRLSARRTAAPLVANASIRLFRYGATASWPSGCWWSSNGISFVRA